MLRENAGMRIGIFLLSARYPHQSHADVLETTLRAAATAESAGFDDVWLAEHHFMSYGVCPSALTLAGHLLGRTERIGVATAVSVLSTQHPVAVAEQANLLDQLCPGRLRLGVGRGGPWVDLEVFGTGLERYELGFPETLDVLLRALRGGGLRADGASFGFREIEVVPGPRTSPRLPVVVAATSDPTAELAARHGLPLLLGMHQTAREQAEVLSRHAETAQRHGHAPGGSVITTLAHVADSAEEARSAVSEALPRWLGPGLAGYVPVDGRPRQRRDPEEYTRFLCDEHALGTPEECAERLRERAAVTGAEELILMVETTGDQQATIDNVARIGAEVLPRVRGSAAASAEAL